MDLTREDFDRGIEAIKKAGIVAGYSESMDEIYFRKLRYIPLDAWKHAVHQVQETCEYFPKLYKILEFTSSYRPVMTDYIETPIDRVGGYPIKWGQLFDSYDEEQRLEKIVLNNPRGKNEKPSDYMDRIIGLSGLLEGKIVVNHDMQKVLDKVPEESYIAGEA